MSKMMSAMVMTAVGGPEVLEMREISRPEIADPHQILVRVMAAGVNMADVRVRERMPPITQWELPPEGIVLGLEGAGIVVTVGEKVTRFLPGDEVYYFDGGFVGWQGNYAQYKALDERYAASKPKSMDFASAAALPVVGITSWEALVDQARVRDRDRLLVQGGAGGLGQLGIQLGRIFGARVAATVSTREKGRLVEGLGAERAIYYREEDVAAAIRDWAGPQGASVVYDTVGDAVFSRSIDLLGVHGRLVTAAYPTAWPDVEIFGAALKNISVSFEAMGHALRGHEFRVEQTRILESIAEYVDNGEIGITVGARFPLAAADEAHRLLENGDTMGKIVLEIGHG